MLSKQCDPRWTNVTFADRKKTGIETIAYEENGVNMKQDKVYTPNIALLTKSIADDTVQKKVHCWTETWMWKGRQQYKRVKVSSDDVFGSHLCNKYVGESGNATTSPKAVTITETKESGVKETMVLDKYALKDVTEGRLIQARINEGTKDMVRPNGMSAGPMAINLTLGPM